MELNQLKLLIEAFKSARKTEIILIIAAVCALLACVYASDSSNGTSTDTEMRMAHILSQIEGAGRVEVMLADDESNLQGAVIVAAGADEIEVHLKIQQAVHAMTGLELNRIEVIESKR